MTTAIEDLKRDALDALNLDTFLNPDEQTVGILVSDDDGMAMWIAISWREAERVFGDALDEIERLRDLRRDYHADPGE